MQNEKRKVHFFFRQLPQLLKRKTHKLKQQKFEAVNVWPCHWLPSTIYAAHEPEDACTGENDLPAFVEISKFFSWKDLRRREGYS